MFFTVLLRIKATIAIPLLLLLTIFATAVSAQVVDRVVAVVNDDIITLSELEEHGREFFDRIRSTAPADEREQALRDARERVLKKLIDQHLVSQEAKKAGVSISESELESSYSKNLAQRGLSREQFLRKLQSSGISEEKYKEDLRNQLLRDKLVLYEIRSKVIVTEEMLKDFFEQEYAEEFEQGGYYLQQIGVSWSDDPDIADADKARAREKAQELREALLDGADFEELARKESDLPSAADGGNLGMFQKDEMADYMREPVVSLEPGEITDVLETPQAFHLFKLVSRQNENEAEDAAFASIKEELRKELFEKKFNEEFRLWVEELKESAYVKNMLYD